MQKKATCGVKPELPFCLLEDIAHNLSPSGRLLWYISPIIYCKDIMQIR